MIKLFLSNVINLRVNRAPQYPPKILGITTHFWNTIIDKCPIYRLLSLITVQINLMCPIILFFFYVHIRLTILTAGITKLAKATNITGELIIVREACAMARWFVTHLSHNVKMSYWAKHWFLRTLETLESVKSVGETWIFPSQKRRNVDSPGARRFWNESSLDTFDVKLKNVFFII